MDPQQILQTAQALANQGQFQQALSEYNKLLQQNPADTRVLLKVGDLLSRSQNYTGAIQAYDRAATVYGEQGAALKAIAVYKQVRELVLQHHAHEADQFGHVVERLTELYMTLGLLNDALRILDEEATRLRNAEREDEALRLYLRMTEVGPNVPLPHLRLAEGLYRTGKVDDALASFSSAATLLLSAEQNDDALRVLERMLHIKPEPEQAKQAARLYLARGTEAEGMQALSRLQICFQADPTDLETLHMLSGAFEMIGHSDRSLEVQKEMARLAHEQGKDDVWNFALDQLRQRAPDDEQVQALMRMGPPSARSSAAPAGSESAAPAPAKPLTNAPPKPARSVAPPRLELVSSKPPPPSTSADTARAPSVVPPSIAPPPVVRAAPTRPPPRPSRRPTPPPTLAPPPPDARDSARITANPPSSKSNFKTLDDVVENTQRVLADAQTFRNLSLFHKAIEQVREAIDVDPQSIELHEMLRDLYTDVGDRDGAIEEMLTMVDIYVEFERPDYGLSVLLNVLDEEQACEPAKEMLRDLVTRFPELEESTDPRYLAALESLEAPQVPSSGPSSSAPHSLSSAPSSSAPLSSAPLSSAPLSSAPSPSAPPPSAPPLPSTPGVNAPISSAPQSIAPPGPPPSSRGAASVPPPPMGSRPSAAQHSAPPSALPPPPPPSGHSRPPPVSAPPPPPPSSTVERVPPQLSLEEALEEIEFFASRGMLGEAQRMIEAQLELHPNHPLLLDAESEIEELKASSQAPQDLSVKIGRPRASDSLDADLQVSLAELEEAVRASQRPPAPGEKTADVDIDEMFDRFKQSVRSQVAESDAATHYDLGLAYKDMALLDDAIEELELAGKEPDHECAAYTAIGNIYAEQKMWDKASKAYSRALSTIKKTAKQECTLYYQLGETSEQLGQFDQSLYYFRQVLRRDQEFRDAKYRVDALGKRKMQTPSGRPQAQDEEVDRAFEEILGD